MSYILDALRKADAERERGQVPGIHAQQLALASAETEGAGHSRTLLWASLGLSAALLALVALLAWHSFGREQAPAIAAVSRPMPITPAEPAATPANPAVPAAPIDPTASPAAAVAATTDPATPQSQTRPSVQGQARQATSMQAAAKHAQARHAAKPVPAKRPVTPEAKVAKAAVASATPLPGKAAKAAVAEPPSTPRTYALSELPADIRQQLPPLTIGGASYSSNPSSRMLIVNGQVFHERDRLTPDLQLLQIRLKSAVLDFKGYRYEIKY